MAKTKKRMARDDARGSGTPQNTGVYEGVNASLLREVGSPVCARILSLGEYYGNQQDM